MPFCLRRDSETRPSQKSSQMARCFLRSISTAVLRPFSSVTNWIPVILLFSLQKKYYPPTVPRPSAPVKAGGSLQQRATPGLCSADTLVRAVGEIAANTRTGVSALHSVIPLLLKRHAHTVGVNRPEFLGPPGLGLQRTVGMHLAAPLLVFGIQCLNTLHGQTHHGLVADLPCQDFVAHASDVEVRLAAVDPCISWRGSVAKSFLEAADLRPPLQRFRSVGSRQNRDRAFNDRAFNRHHCCPGKLP